MKELTTEQKAESYDKVVEVLKERFANEEVCGLDKSFLQKLIPELAESEDEKIRKAIAWCIDTVVNELDVVEPEGLSVNKLKSWLEKQVEQKIEWSQEDLICLGLLADFVDKNGDDFYGKNKPNVVKWIRSFAELPTHKPINEIEQKSEWNIDNAKCGDILAYPDGTIAVFNYRLDGLDAGLYMSFLVCSSTGINYNQTCAINNVTKATKEQIETLFNKLRNDIPIAWSEEDEDLINYVCSVLTDNFNENDAFDDEHPCIGVIVDKLKSLNPQKHLKL